MRRDSDEWMLVANDPDMIAEEIAEEASEEEMAEDLPIFVATLRRRANTVINNCYFGVYMRLVALSRYGRLYLEEQEKDLWGHFVQISYDRLAGLMKTHTGKIRDYLEQLQYYGWIKLIREWKDNRPQIYRIEYVDDEEEDEDGA